MVKVVMVVVVMVVVVMVVVVMVVVVMVVVVVVVVVLVVVVMVVVVMVTVVAMVSASDYVLSYVPFLTKLSSNGRQPEFNGIQHVFLGCVLHLAANLLILLQVARGRQ